MRSFDGHHRAPLLPTWLWGLLSLATAACDSSPSGTEAMAQRLVDVVAATDPTDNLYRNTEQAELLRQQIDALPEGAPAGQLKAAYGEQLLLAGQTGAAIEVFEAMSARFAEMGDRVAPAMAGEMQRMLLLSYLRLAEESNCLDHHNPDSCLLPLAGGGVHVEPEGGRKAFEILSERLAENEKDWEARWLINLAAMTLGTWPDGVPEAWRLGPELFASDFDPGRFPDVGREVGVAVTGLAGGVVMEDLDGDGLLDLLVSSWGVTDPLHLLRNRGDGSFDDVTADAGVEGLTGGLNMLHADYDNDGDADVLVLRGGWFEKQGGHPNSLLRNDGSGHFDDVTEASGLLSFHPTQTAAWGDYDGDGWLDLFIGNETGPDETHPCELFHNQGDGTFVDVAARCDLNVEVYAKGTAWGDVDDDGDVDLYISRIDGPNLLFRNDGPVRGSLPERGVGDPARHLASKARAWRFVDVAAQAGVTKPKRSFPTWFFDYDNDGRLDLFVSGFRYKSAGWVARDYVGKDGKGVRAKLFRNLGGMAFEDVSESMEIDKVLLTMGSNFGDIDNDGWLDLYCATGEPDYGALYPNRMFRNGEGQIFQDATTAGGFGHAQKGHGIAFGDLDNDGDQDVYAVMGGAYEGDVYPNALFLNPGHDHHWLTLVLEGVEANRCAIGARVAVRVATPTGERTIHVTVGTGGSFGSSSLAQEIGLGDATSILDLTIRWPGSGRSQVLTDLPMDWALKVVEGATSAEPLHRPLIQLDRG